MCTPPGCHFYWGPSDNESQYSAGPSALPHVSCPSEKGQQHPPLREKGTVWLAVSHWMKWIPLPWNLGYSVTQGKEVESLLLSKKVKCL